MMKWQAIISSSYLKIEFHYEITMLCCLNLKTKKLCLCQYPTLRLIGSYTYLTSGTQVNARP